MLERLRGLTRISLFADPAMLQGDQAKVLGQLNPHRIELYTEAYADAFPTTGRERVTATYRQAAESALKLGLGMNAGHDLNQDNLGYLINAIPELEEVSIGHALICQALEQGLETTVRNYLEIVKAT